MNGKPRRRERSHVAARHEERIQQGRNRKVDPLIHLLKRPIELQRALRSWRAIYHRSFARRDASVGSRARVAGRLGRGPRRELGVAGQ